MCLSLRLILEIDCIPREKDHLAPATSIQSCKILSRPLTTTPSNILSTTNWPTFWPLSILLSARTIWFASFIEKSLVALSSTP
ncbi:hypothetical protein EDC96DRAFT_562243 [Choanephora cucurbitarum]|nr:hypothetical protein EDC96DRAFT_562243 [Choanephora cucurbitarum]